MINIGLWSAKYSIDTRFIPFFDRSGKANLGHALETAALLELDRRGAEVGYVQTEQEFEVDFLARFPDGAKRTQVPFIFRHPGQ
jgi:predicted AAA+ superfamily ATPase